METLLLEKTRNTPKILMDPLTGIIEISGSSFPEDGITLYTPVFEWIDEYLKSPKDTVVNIDLKYFNTSSAKLLLMAVKSLSEISKKNLKLTINWLYIKDDEDIFDTGVNFAKLTGLKFNMIEKHSNAA